MKLRTRYVVVAAAVILTLGTWWSMRARPIEVETAPVTRGTFEETIVENGRTHARWHVAITAPVGGEWRPAGLAAGDSVRAGTLLGTLAAAPTDPATAGQLAARLGAAEAALNSARSAAKAASSALEAAERALRRAERLGSAGAVSEEQRELARTEFELREREVDVASARVVAAMFERDAVRALLPGGAAAPVGVRAPADGVVLRVDEEDSRIVGAGTPLLQVGALDALEVVVSVLSSDAVRVRPGALLRTTCGRDTTSGRVTRIEPSARTVRSALGVDEQRVSVIGDLRSCPRLGHDFELEVQLVVARREGSLLVPAGALARAGGGQWMVFTVDANARARRRTVTLVARGPDEAAIEGLDEGTTVVVYPPEALSDGTKVRATRR